MRRMLRTEIECQEASTSANDMKVEIKSLNSTHMCDPNHLPCLVCCDDLCLRLRLTTPHVLSERFGQLNSYQIERCSIETITLY